MTDPYAIVTVTYNSAHDLATHWRGSPFAPGRWLIIDNASSDNSIEVGATLGATVVESAENLGFSRANNRGVREIDADCYAFLNPDVQPTEAGLRTLCDYALEHRCIVAPQLLNSDGSAQENGRTSPYLYRKILHFLGSSRSASEYEVIAAPGDVVTVDWAIGAALIVPKSIFDAIGGWNEKYFIYYEDSEFCLRAKRCGYETRLHGGVRWTHGWNRATRKGFSYTAWKLELRSALRFYRTHPRLLLHPSLHR